MKKTYLIIFIACIILITILINIGLFNNPLISNSYVTFSDGIVIEYPSNWYRYIGDYNRKEGSLPFELYSNNNYNPYDGISVIVNEKGISDIKSAIESIEKEIMSINQTNPELISKDLKENTGTVKFKWTWPPARNATVYAFYKIIKCNEKLFQLNIGTAEPFNLEHASEIEHLINSFRCK